MKKVLYFILLLSVFIFIPGMKANAEANNLIIEKVTTSPEIVEPGDEFKINFTLKNNGSKELQGIVIKLVGIEGKEGLGGFSPLNTANEIYAGSISKDKTSEASINMISDPQLKAGTYNLIVNLSYKEKGGRAYSDNRIIGVVLTNKPSLLITSLVTPDKAAEKVVDNKVTMDFVNTGKAVLNDVLVTLTANDKKYIKYFGTVEPGDENNFEEKLDLKGDVNGLVEITYKDEMNKEGKVSKDFSIKGEETKAAKETGKSKGGFFAAIGNFFKRLFGLGA